MCSDAGSFPVDFLIQYGKLQSEVQFFPGRLPTWTDQDSHTATLFAIIRTSQPNWVSIRWRCGGLYYDLGGSPKYL